MSVRDRRAGGSDHDALETFVAFARQLLGVRAESPGPPAAPGPDPRPIRFEDWSEYTTVERVPACTARDAEHVVELCNQAASDGHRVRALGHAHNWSPLVLPPKTPAAPPVLLIDTSNLVGASAAVVDGRPHATFGTGITLEAATAFLESLDNGGTGEAPGYSFSNMPTPGGLTLGGILAVGGHGTSVPWARAEPDLMGCLSNSIVSFKAVTTDPDRPGSSDYAVREFHRSDPDAPAFLVHLGRTFITEVTLAPVPNYYLQLTNVFAPVDEVLGPPASSPDTALSTLLDAHGRVEVIWFPGQRTAWVQCNTRQPTRIEPQVPGPYNYEWMNWLSRTDSDVVREVLALDPALTERFATVEAAVANANMNGTVLNGTARDLQIYVTDSTLRMGICGYALQLPRREVQLAVNAFYVQVQAMLDAYLEQHVHPVNGAVEIRCTTVDRQHDLGIEGARPPALAATHSVDADDASLDTVLWVDVLTFPDTKGSSEFFTGLEQWMIKTWCPGTSGRLRPEWSKGWAYTADGPWTDSDLIGKWVPSVYDAATDGLTFTWAKQTLARYDDAGIFGNAFLDRLFA